MDDEGCKQDTTPKACTKNSELPSKTWLSNGVELLFERNGLNKDGEPFDAVIVGGGYGDSIKKSLTIPTNNYVSYLNLSFLINLNLLL